MAWKPKTQAQCELNRQANHRALKALSLLEKEPRLKDIDLVEQLLEHQPSLPVVMRFGDDVSPIQGLEVVKGQLQIVAWFGEH